MQQLYSSVSPSDQSVFDRSSLFKIARVGDTSRYIIRSMLNNSLSFGISDNEVITKEIPSVDDNVPIEDTFCIEWDGEGFLIYPYGSARVIELGGSNLSTVSKAYASNNSRWQFSQYTGLHKNGSSIYYTDPLTVGTTVTITPIVWATNIDYNTPELSVLSGYTDKATCTWNASTRTGALTLHDDGTLKIRCHIYDGDHISDRTTTYNLYPELVVEEGIYYFKNKDTGKYMQIDNNAAYHENDAIMELWGYQGDDWQKWQLVHIRDGYYKIQSVISGYAVCVKAGEIDDDEVALVQQPYSDLDRMHWMITKSSSGAYIIRPKSGESGTKDWCMCAGDYFFITSGLNVEQQEYVDNKSYMDEWILQLDSLTSDVLRMPNPDAQNKTWWCWAASAKMVGEHNGVAGSLPNGAATLSISTNVHSFEGKLFYGENVDGSLTVDAGQRAIVISRHGDDGNHSGTYDDMVEGMILATCAYTNAGTWGSSGSTLSTSEIEKMNIELANGRWVIGNIFYLTNLNMGHAIVIRNYDSTSEEYTYWDPWTDTEGIFTRTQILTNTIQTVNDENRMLATVNYLVN